MTIFRTAALFILLLCSCRMDHLQQSSPSRIAIVVHGGASNIKKLNLTAAEEAAYQQGLSDALDAGYAVLKNGGTSIDAACAAVQVLENNPLFNAGKGSVIAHNGAIEMDAAVMDGATLRCGAVTGIRTAKNPVLAARQVMLDGQFILLSGEGADEFAKLHQLEIVDTAYFYTPYRRAQWEKARKKKDTELDNDSRGGVLPIDETQVEKFGTVGCVALDQHGNLAAATSTGGLVNKQYNRIGDTPLIGAGTYADNRACAVSCTGKGEDFIRLTIASDIAARMKYEKSSLKTAANQVILQELKNAGGRGGCIAIDRKGHIVMPFTTSGMFRGMIDTKGHKETAIYKSTAKR